MGFIGIPNALAEWIASLGLSPVQLIICLTFFFIAMGCFLDGISVIVLTTSVVRRFEDPRIGLARLRGLGAEPVVEERFQLEIVQHSIQEIVVDVGDDRENQSFVAERAESVGAVIP